MEKQEEGINEKKQEASSYMERLQSKDSYFKQPYILFKQRDPKEEENVCMKELEEFTNCEFTYKQNAGEECQGIREQYIECRKQYNKRKKLDDEREQYILQQFYFLSESGYTAVSVPSEYDAEMIRKRKF